MVKKQRPATMHDVAKLAGVSQSTVSRILSQSQSSIPISDETARRVYDAINALGYQLNMTARSLRTQRTDMIAVMIADISNPFYHAITRTIQDIAAQHNYDVIIANSDHLHEYEKRFCDMLLRRPVDGIIMVPYHLTADELAQMAERTGAPLAVLARHIEHPQIDTVSSDDEKATYEAVRWLIHDKGHRRIGFIGVTPHFPVGARRLHGYQKAMQDAELPIYPQDLQTGDFSVTSGVNAMRTLLAQPDPPTAVFVINDIMAIGGLNAALDMGLRVPEDVAIVGFDNIPVSELVRPQITTVAQFPVDIGRELANLVFERINGSNKEHRKIDIPCQLIERQST
jgi:DNA-binding LacI/PurR family transcriptional regulator